MDLQGTKEARTQEEGAEGPLEAYGASGGRSKEYRKNEGRDSHNHDDRSSIHPLRRRRPPFSYPHGAQRSASPVPVPATLIRSREPSPSPEAISIPQALGLGSRDQRILRKARRCPPVTKKTLSELDLPCIMSNINLRMDANFDRDLHFKPDLEGEKGQRKRKDAADYWDALATEITIYAFRAATADSTEVESSDDIRRSFDPRLPSLFETLQDVIKTLVPERDHPTVMQNLEVPLLMQQIHKGVLDMLTLATWLAALLKTHCAPMRDEWADQMVEQVKKGSLSQDPQEIVNGLQTLFNILEAMKLDVANHQIRAFRVLLIEDTVPFLQEYFQGKLNRGSFLVDSARDWYLSVRDQARREDANANAQESTSTTTPEVEDTLKPLEALFRGISSQLLQFLPPTEFPETFLFDSERLWQLRSTIQNLINLDIAWYIFESYVNKHKRYLSAPEETYTTFRSRIWSLMENGMELEPRIAGDPQSNDNDPDHRGGKRWTQNMRCIALEIARFACAALQLDPVVADEVIVPIEEALEWHLSNETDLYTFFQNSMRSKVLATTLTAARKYLPLSPLAICESQRLPLSTPSGFAPTEAVSGLGGSSQALTLQQQDIERIGMRLAHIGVLHWRVWAPLLYLRDEIAMVELEQALV